MANREKQHRGSLARAHDRQVDLFSGVTPLDKKCRASYPGMDLNHKRRPSTSDFAVQLKMKQLIRRQYGVMEKPFRNLYKEASARKGNTAYHMMCFLESRLDNTIYRMGYASTRREARQIVSHGHIKVNGSRVTIPSYRLLPGDEIVLTDKSKGMVRVNAAIDLS